LIFYGSCEIVFVTEREMTHFMTFHSLAILSCYCLDLILLIKQMIKMSKAATKATCGSSSEDDGNDGYNQGI